MTYEDGLYNGIDIYGNKFTECQRCGNKEYYWTVHVHASTIHDSLSYTPIGKWAYCSDCRKALFKWRI